MKSAKGSKKTGRNPEEKKAGSRRKKSVKKDSPVSDYLKDDSLLKSEIFNLLDIGLFIIDVLPKNKFRIAGFNRIAEEKTGISNDEIAGKTLDELKKIIPEHLVRELENNYTRCLKKKTRIRYEESVLVRGTEFWALTTLNPLKNSRGRITRLFGTSIIISDFREREKYQEEYRQKLETLIEERTKDLALLNRELKVKADEQQKITEQLFESNEMFQFVLDTIPQRVFWKDRNFKFLGCNRKILEDGGLARLDEVLGKDDFELPWKEFAQLYREDDSYVMKNDVQKLNFEEPQNTPDGGIRWLRTNKMPLKDKDGNIFGILGTYEDITEKKLTEEKIRESERFLKSILGNIPGLIYRCLNDKDWTMVYLSERSYELTGYRTEEMLYNKTVSYAEIIHPEDAELVWDTVQEGIAKKSKYEIEYRIITRQNRIKWVWEQGQGIFEGDKLLYLEGYIVDISARKKVLQDLYESEQKYRTLSESSRDYVFIHDLNGKISYVNTFGASALGKKPEELTGKSVAKIFPRQFAERFRVNTAKVFESGKPLMVDGEALFGSRLLWISTHLIPLSDEKGIVQQVMGISRDITELKNAERKLAESEKQYRHIIDNSAAGITRSNLKGEIFYANDTIINIFEYSDLEDMKKDNAVYRYKNPERRKQMISMLKRYGKIDNFEFEAVSVKGRELVLTLNSRIEGEMIESVFVDITDKVRAERKLAESEKSLRAFMNAIPQSAFLIDSDGTVLVSNKSTPIRYGVNYQDFVGKNFFMAVSEKFSAVLRNNIVKILDSKQPVMFEEQINGQYYENYLFPVFGEGGEVSRIAVITIDNTDKIKTAEDTRYKSFLLTNVNDAIVATDTERRITFWNDAAEEIYGWKAEEVLGKFADDILGTEAEEGEKLDALERIRKQGSYNTNLVQHTKSSERITIEAKGFPIKNFRGELIGYGSINRDITEKLKSEEKLRKYAEELEELNATKDRFFSIISHDLRNPFHALLGISDILRSKISELSQEEIVNLSKAIYETAKREFDLLVNLLEWSVIQTGRLEIKPEKINLKEAVEDIINVLSENLKQKIIEVNHNFESDIEITSDSRIIRVLLLNLLTNAMKYSNRNSEIMILHYTEHDFIKIIFRDNGTGMDEETLRGLFKIGKRGSAPGTENERGTGLGLIICREMLNKIGGSISASSRKGKGSTFTIALPRKL